MTRRLRALRSRRDGSAAVEFALAVPLMILFLAGISQVGILFAANAGLQQALGEGARFATLYPRPDDSAVTARVQKAAFALNSHYLSAPVLTHGTSNGVPYIDISLTYRPPTNFVFFQGPTLSITRSRRAYLN